MQEPVATENLADFVSRNWNELWPRLRLFAYGNYGWLQKRVVGGLDLEVIIQESIVDTLTGIRTWPPVDKDGNIKNVKLITFLCQTVRSKVSHTLEEELKRVSLEDAAEELLANSPAMALIKHEEATEQRAIYNELVEQARQAFSTDVFSRDELVTTLIEIYIEMPDMYPSEIAERLNIPVDQVNNAKRRLTRQARKFMPGWSNA